MFKMKIIFRKRSSSAAQLIGIDVCMYKAFSVINTVKAVISHITLLSVPFFVCKYHQYHHANNTTVIRTLFSFLYQMKLAYKARD